MLRCEVLSCAAFVLTGGRSPWIGKSPQTEQSYQNNHIPGVLCKHMVNVRYQCWVKDIDMFSKLTHIDNCDIPLVAWAVGGAVQWCA